MPDESLFPLAPPRPLPDHVAPPPRGRTAPGVIVAIVLASMALALSVVVGLVTTGAVAYLYFQPAPGGAWMEGELPGEYAQGTVKAADGSTVEGIGTVERPARIGEHTLSWPSSGGGVLDATVTTVDWDAEALLTGTFPETPPPSPGMVYVQVTMDLEYTGPGTVAPARDLWVSLETWSWSTYADELSVQSEKSLWEVGFLSDGDAAEVTVVLEMTEGERSSALLVIETIDGEPLALAED